MNSKIIISLKVIVLLFLIFFSCSGRDKETEFINAIVNLEDVGYKYEDVPVETVNEIKKIVRKYRNELAGRIKDTEDLGILYKRMAKKYIEIAQINREIEKIIVDSNQKQYPQRDEDVLNKMLAIRYIDAEMYGKAFTYFEKARAIYPGNPILYYYCGLCAGWIAKSQVGPQKVKEQELWFKTSVEHYLKAIEIDPYYVDALYGLSILLAYELSKPGEALMYINRILEKEKKNTKAHFLLARVYYQIGRIYDALDIYDKIITMSVSDEVKLEVIKMKERIKEELYESE